MAQRRKVKTNQNNPETLYENCLDCYVSNLNYNVNTLDSVQQLRYLPPGVLIDVYVMMSQCEHLGDMLLEQLADLEIFERLIKFEPARQKLFACFSALASSKKPLAGRLKDHFTQRHKPIVSATNRSSNNIITNSQHSDQDTAIAIEKRPSSSSKARNFIFYKFSHKSKDSTSVSPGKADDSISDSNTSISTSASTTTATTDSTSCSGSSNDIVEQAEALLAASDLNDDDRCSSPMTMSTVSFGLRLGSFLSEAGWLWESIEVLACVASHLRMFELDLDILVIRIDCLQRLLHSQSAMCNFKAAERTFDEIIDLLKETKTDTIPRSLLANTYAQLSAMYFARSEYDDSHMFSVMAMRNLDNTTPERIAIDVLRQAAKACVVKRDYWRANVLICQAMRRASKAFGNRHQKYADTLLDYGFFLLNVDSVYLSVKNYVEALDITLSIFGERNLHVALAHEDVSYAYYVHEYSTGNFAYAREHVERAVDIMQDLVPPDHLMLASAKRVKALLLEEIALDKMAEGIDEQGLLKQSEELHKFALKLSLEIFGEVNVQTAKHYGNLGRLYQTMSRFEEAERMHQKAIKIKTDLLGPYDHEVGLSIGHLASLYNYHMKKYREAEDLYLRSIEISRRLFGRSYSGLEYDYLGLCHVYEALSEFDKYIEYADILENWAVLRGQNKTMNKSIYPVIEDECTLEEVKEQFFSMLTNVTACN